MSGLARTTLRYRAVDTWFFRDAQPYNQGESNQLGLGSLFPPSTRTLVGATRAAMARSLGWDGRSAWDEALKARLGDADVLAPLGFRGPLLLCGGELVFPLPLSVLGVSAGGSFVPRTVLLPGRAMHCDLGARVRMPRPQRSVPGLKLAEDAWVTGAGMEALLGGALPEPGAVVSRRALFREEVRVGIARDSRTRTVQDGALYSTRHVRPSPGVALTMDVGGWSGGGIERLVPLGGDGRMAECEEIGGWVLPGCPVIEGATKAAVYVVTPAQISPTQLKPGALKVRGLEGLSLISACVGKVQRVGGWDVAKRRPVAVGSLLPPGTVLFVEGSAEDIAGLRGRHGETVGDRADWGHGMILVGRWDDDASEGG